MKILILIDSRSDPFVGSWYNKCKELGIDVKILSFFDNSNIHKDDFIMIKSKIPGHRLKILTSLKKIIKAINNFKPDLIHAIQVTRQGFLAGLLDFHPFIVTAIGSDVFIEPKKSRIEKYIVQRSFDKADLITSMAEHMTDYIKNNFKVDEKKLITFPWGCDTRIFNLKGRDCNKNEPLIICTRRMDNELYNQELIIQAAPEILKKNPATKFVFIGGGHFMGNYKNLVKQKEIDKNVIFLGWQTPEQIAGWLKKSLIFVSPTRSDGNNISLNEAMACGCFPICSDIPANRQWYKENSGGYFINPDSSDQLAEKINSALNDKKFRDEALKENEKTVEARGDWNKQAEKMFKIWKSVAKL